MAGPAAVLGREEGTWHQDPASDRFAGRVSGIFVLKDGIMRKS